MKVKQHLSGTIILRLNTKDPYHNLYSGYAYPDDPHVLKGSCGLEYKLHYTDVRYNQDRSREQQWNTRGRVIALLSTNHAALEYDVYFIKAVCFIP